MKLPLHTFNLWQLKYICWNTVNESSVNMFIESTLIQNNWTSLIMELPLSVVILEHLSLSIFISSREYSSNLQILSVILFYGTFFIVNLYSWQTQNISSTLDIIIIDSTSPLDMASNEYRIHLEYI